MPYDKTSCAPTGVAHDGMLHFVVPGNQFGLYQALSTRNGGEVMSADSCGIFGARTFVFFVDAGKLDGSNSRDRRSGLTGPPAVVRPFVPSRPLCDCLIATTEDSP